jgi:hypothetical protein
MIIDSGFVFAIVDPGRAIGTEDHEVRRVSSGLTGTGARKSQGKGLEPIANNFTSGLQYRQVPRVGGFGAVHFAARSA